MVRTSVLALGAVAGLAWTPLPGWQSPRAPSEQQLTVRTLRFYRAEANRTRIKAFFEVSYALLEPPPGDSTQSLAYRVDVALTDSTGLTLLRQGWWGHGPADLRQTGAATMEMIDFAVAPGKYRLAVQVRDSVSGRSVETSSPIEGFQGPPDASDLWLAPKIREVEAQDSVPRPGELREGNNLVTAAAHLVLTPLRPMAYYVVEAYSAEERSGTVSIAVVDSSDGMVVQASPVPVKVSAGGGVLSGRMDLTGLPPGDYTMRLSLAFERDTVQRESGFTMRGMKETLAVDSAIKQAGGGTEAAEESYFGAMTAKQLDEAKAPLLYVAKPGELSSYKRDLSVTAKRRFLNEFWQRRDPTPGTAANEAREDFYNAIAYVNREFKEGGRNTVPGWRSDRGRIYTKSGAPDDILRRQQEGSAPRYQVWRYTRDRNRYYIFADRTGFGAYNLIATNDVSENGLANWRELLGYDAVEDVGRFLGMNFLAY
jgi:GWxTD domain-containing protein